MATIKELLSAMIDKINGNEDRIDNIEENGVGGGVTGGGGTFIVTVTESDDGVHTADKTFDEISNAIEQGEIVILRKVTRFPDGMEMYNYLSLNLYVVETAVTFVHYTVSSLTGVVIFTSLGISSTNEVIVETKSVEISV